MLSDRNLLCVLYRCHTEKWPIKTFVIVVPYIWLTQFFLPEFFRFFFHGRFSPLMHRYLINVFFFKWHRHFIGTVLNRAHESTSWEVQLENMWICLLVCKGYVSLPTLEFFTHMETSSFPVRKYRTLPHLLWHGASVYNGHLRGHPRILPSV